MSLAATYQKFLAAPTPEALAENASMNYITTLTTINAPEPIIKHLKAQAKQVKKLQEKVIASIEGDNGLCVDVETTLEFLTGGGAYLPNLDDNFLSSRKATFPAVHIVRFDAQQKISRIRLYWDQGSLLKQVEVIGARAKNWPIRDGKDQLRLVVNSSSASASQASVDRSRSSTTTQADEVSITSRPSTAGRTSVSRGERTSLDLFAERDVNQEERGSFPSFTPRPSAKPAPREYHELFAGGNDSDASPETQRKIAESPKKNDDIRAKAGATKHFASNRLFDENDEPASMMSPATKTNAKKYNHFDFGDDGANEEPADMKSPATKISPEKYKHFDFGEGEDAPKVVETARTKQHQKNHSSQWDFADETPIKPSVKVRDQEQRHFGWSDDEVEKTPVRREVVHRPRASAQTHFDFADDQTPPTEKARPRTHAPNKGHGLYEDHILGDDEQASFGAAPYPLQHSTNNNTARAKDFDPHFSINDKSPATSRTTVGPAQPKPQSTNGPQSKVLKTMEANWGMNENSPSSDRKDWEGGEAGNIYKTSGNGMGGRKGQGLHWGFGDDDEATETGAATKKEAPGKENRRFQGSEKGFWDF